MKHSVVSTFADFYIGGAKYFTFQSLDVVVKRVTASVASRDSGPAPTH